MIEHPWPFIPRLVDALTHPAYQPLGLTRPQLARWLRVKTWRIQVTGEASDGTLVEQDSELTVYHDQERKMFVPRWQVWRDAEASLLFPLAPPNPQVQNVTLDPNTDIAESNLNVYLFVQEETEPAQAPDVSSVDILDGLYWPKIFANHDLDLDGGPSFWWEVDADNETPDLVGTWDGHNVPIALTQGNAITSWTISPKEFWTYGGRYDAVTGERT